ncbi:ADP-ribosylglycohydrolase family protein [Rhizobium leguminosarum]|uniref:ADP-ribosylglycohydrolase family protein n=1 Tax=Rhizobium leguminosarum TaxID=384 RepID=UPI001FDAC436|nr:ADP-ribosylglycohydrolase family protein [Rhizobium leguminosarum]WFT88447.1 ADP-ribosylglycohydrolase family protein [Rhizobium leguminosarum]
MPQRPTEAKFRGVILGAALGDALGWPHENRARNTSSTPRGSLSFRDWTKRSGGRFQPHEERIPAGSYSDDTQLIITVARSRLVHRRWWDYFSQVELPFWTLYERGGGGATIRAAKSWLKRTQPWLGAPGEVENYFKAGGNGGAMRIAPHVLMDIDQPFSVTAKNIVIDCVVTHGHPQAIVGALAYGFALWFALRNRETLEYGQLITEVLENQDQWTVWPGVDEVWPNWLTTAAAYGFEDKWVDAVEAQARQLQIAHDSLQAGALSLDQETLEAIGCFDKTIFGAGTVAASAAIFLASRYAAGPMEGVAAAAFSKGMDTDTIASMTGALGGAISGFDWLGSLVREVQDYEFLLDLAGRLQSSDPSDAQIEPITDRFVSEFIHFLEGKGSAKIPTGLPKSVHDAEMVRSKSDNLRARSWVLDDPRAQTIVIKKLDRPRNRSAEVRKQDTFNFDESHPPQSHHTQFAGVGLFAADLKKSTHFYRDLLGLPITRETTKLIRLGSHLVLRQSEESVVAGTGTVVYIQVNDLEACFKKIVDKDAPKPQIEQIGNRRSFLCSDPDGRTVEVFQHLN